MLFYIQFNPTCTASDFLMPLEALSHQEAVDMARKFYGKSVQGVVSLNQINNIFHTIPWGSIVHYVELDDKQNPIFTLVYPNQQYNLDPIKSITNWFKEANPEPENKDIAVQIGVHIEEFREMLTALEEVNPTIIAPVKEHLLAVENLFKNLGSEFDFKGLNQDKKVELLDSLCDQTVTATGIAYRMGFNFYPALNEVSNSNWSKFENGKPLRDSNGKIIKGKNYFKPDLTKFV